MICFKLDGMYSGFFFLEIENKLVFEYCSDICFAQHKGLRILLCLAFVLCGCESEESHQRHAHTHTHTHTLYEPAKTNRPLSSLREWEFSRDLSSYRREENVRMPPVGWSGRSTAPRLSTYFCHLASDSAVSPTSTRNQGNRVVSVGRTQTGLTKSSITHDAVQHDASLTLGHNLELIPN